MNNLIISLDGGLGNQLFMLFAGISKTIDEKRDFRIYLENNKRKFYFNSYFDFLKNKILNYNPIINNYYIEPFHHYNQIPNNCDFIKGYFQSPKYFENNYLYLRKLFKIDEFQNKFKFDFKYIAIHFRLGDYLELKGAHITIPNDYYINGLIYLKEKLGNEFDNYKFIVFGEIINDDIISNKINEIKKIININFIKYYDINNDNDDFKEFIYMSNAEHLIIANSTYSWFSAYLCNNKNKIIIRPSYNNWYGENLRHLNLKDFCPPEWIIINQ